MQGTAFDLPIAAGSVRAQDVKINGADVVPLGGDFWHLPYPIGKDRGYFLRSVSAGAGVLESDRFRILKPHLAYLIGGSSGGGASLELRVPRVTSEENPDFPALDSPDPDDYVAVLRASPTGSDVLREFSWPVHGLVGETGKIRLSIAGAVGDRLLVAEIRLLAAPPPPFHPRLWGWADIHCHPMAQAGFGGLMAGHMHGPVEDLGSCLQEHGANHKSLPFHLVPMAVENKLRSNDGSLKAPGWTVGTPVAGEQFGFTGWPAFDDLTHIKVHQDWIRRAYDGGQRLMVALIVHSELLASLNGAPQSDRDTVEPQIQMLKEFVAHNGAWSGLAKTPAEARTLIEQNKLAFVLGIETDTINGWVDSSKFPTDRAGIHTQLHDYFAYLKQLGVVQVNLLHVSDNAFGGMALYDLMFIANSRIRTGAFPKTEVATLSTPPAPGTAATDDDDIHCRVTVEAALWSQIESILPGFPKFVGAPSTSFPPAGDVNAIGLTEPGKVALLEAMRLGMVIDLDHMSEKSAVDAHMIATTEPTPKPYPLVSAHNGARRMAPRPLHPLSPSIPAPPIPAPRSVLRAAAHSWPNENMKSNVQLAFIKETNGMFGHGTASHDLRSWGELVPNDCPGSDKTFAQGYQYVRSVLGDRVGFGTDWNSLLAGPGPRFGTRAANGLVAEVAARSDPDWQTAVRLERLQDALAQRNGVLYDTPLRDWRTYRFSDRSLYDGSDVANEGHFLWQAMAISAANVDVATATRLDPGLAEEVRELVLGMSGLPPLAPPGTEPRDKVLADFHRAGALMGVRRARLADEDPHVEVLVTRLREVGDLWAAMSSGQTTPMTRSTAGPIRDFDYNLDGLAHYGMIPDMLQDLKNVKFPEAEMIALFSSAEQYIRVWEASVEIGAGLPH